MNTTTGLLHTIDTGLLTLTIDRPHAANAIDSSVSQGLAHFIQKAQQDSSIHAVVLTGTGDRAFCAGRDTKVPAGEDPVQLDMQRRNELWTYTDALLTFDKPLVVAVNSSAIGAGFMLCLHADQVLSVPNAVFSLPEINIGISSWLGHCLVAEIAGNALANDMSITGRKVDAIEALSKGLIHAIVPASTLQADAITRARSLIEKPRHTFRDIKQWILKRRQQSVDIARQRHQLNNQA